MDKNIPKWKLKIKKCIIKRVLAPLVFVLIISVFLLPLNCFAYTGFTNTPLRGQETEYWCWAASDQMLLETQGIIKTQTQVAGSYNHSVYPSQAKERLLACSSNIQWDLTYNYLSMNSVENTIDLGWAIFCNTVFYNFHNQMYYGHAMVVTGYKRGANETDKVWLQDPYGDDPTAPHDGEEGWCIYSALISGNYSGTIFYQWQNYAWQDTIC